MSWRRAGAALCAAATVVAAPAALAGQRKAERRPAQLCAAPLEQSIRRASECVRIAKERRGVPGISVAVSVDGRRVWSEGFGYANVETLTPCTDRTLMRIASISKPITATLVARHVQCGALRLDDTVAAHVPYWPGKCWDGNKVDITVRQLLCHTAGVRHYRSAESDHNKNPLVDEKLDSEVYNRRDFATTEEAVALFKDDPLVAKPGSQLAYTTHGYTLLAAVCESVGGGQPFAHQLEAFFEELGMRRTHLDRNAPLLAGRASYYCREANGHELTNVPSVDCSYKWAGGGIVSTAPDLLIFANHILYAMTSAGRGDELIRRDIMEQFLAPATTQTFNKKGGKRVEHSYALGWYVEPGTKRYAGNLNVDGTGEHWNGSDYVAHTGSSVGVSSMLFIKPNRDATAAQCGKGAPGVCVAILANMHGVSLHAVAADVAASFCDS